MVASNKSQSYATFMMVLVLAPLVIWIIGSVTARNTIALPRTFMYDFRTVFDSDHQVVYPFDAVKELMASNKGRLTDLDTTSDKFYAHMHALQTAKYGSMCYGNREDMHLTMQHHEDLICEVGDASNPWSQQDNNDKDKRELVRSLLLEKWQRETEGADHKFFGSRSFCACVDEMHFSLVNSDVTNQKKKQLLNTLATLSTSNISYLNAISTSLRNHTAYEHIILNQIDYAGSVSLQTIVQNMRSSNLLLDTKELHLTDEQKILDFCTHQSLPMQTMIFNGIMDSWRYVVLGQFLLLLSCFVSFEVSWLGPHAPLTTENQSNEFEFVKQTENSSTHPTRSRSSYVFTALRVVLYLLGFVLSFIDTGRYTFADELRYEIKASHASNPHGHMSVFSDVSNIDMYHAGLCTIVWVLLLLLEIVKVYIVLDNSDREQTLSNRLIYTVLQDVLNVFALTILSIGVQLQMGVKETSTVYIVATVVACTALVQHISNLIGIYFDWLASQNSPQRERKILDNCDAETAKVILRVCYVRSGIFLYVLLATVFIVAHVGVTRALTTSHDVKSMAGLLFGIAFFVILCGFDFIYELFNIRGSVDKSKPYTISSQDRRWLHVSFVYSYIVFINFVQSTQKFA